MQQLAISNLLDYCNQLLDTFDNVEFEHVLGESI